MAKIIFHQDFLAFTGGLREVEFDVKDYRACKKEIFSRFPQIDENMFSQFMVTLDGAIIHNPFLETLSSGSELVFVKKLSSG